MRADMSNESRDNFLINRSSTWFGVAPDDVRLARMEDEFDRVTSRGDSLGEGQT
jgi:hypothetical protein